MKKLTTTAFLLMSLANVSYGQELTYLNCPNNPDDTSVRINRPARIIVLNNESKTWDTFSLFSDEVLAVALDEGNVSRRSQIVSGTLNREILSITSQSFTLQQIAAPQITYELDRITGDLHHGPEWFGVAGELAATCSPTDKASLENLLQQRINRRDELIKENEAKRLF